MKPDRSKKRTNHARGLWAEALAALYLRVKGYRILARRYKTRWGEVDIVARRGDLLAFVEVKSRATLGTALDSVTPPSRRRIADAARQFLADHPDLSCLMVRFDVVAVPQGGMPVHTCDAWQCEGEW